MTGRRFVALLLGLFAFMLLLSATLLALAMLLHGLLAPTPQTRLPVLAGILAGCLVVWALLIRWHRGRLVRGRAGEAASGPPRALRKRPGGGTAHR